MITEITKAQLLALHCGRLKDAGKLDAAHISMLKRNNAAMALECARLSRDLLGANGITDEYPIMRHLCNLETVKTYEGTDHIHALVIGERVTGIAAYQISPARSGGCCSRATILLSAFLLFQVQPLIAKLILPWFGGSAAVWTSCMLFFQIALLGGLRLRALAERADRANGRRSSIWGCSR